MWVGLRAVDEHQGSEILSLTRWARNFRKITKKVPFLEKFREISCLACKFPQEIPQEISWNLGEDNLCPPMYILCVLCWRLYGSSLFLYQAPLMPLAVVRYGRSLWLWKVWDFFICIFAFIICMHFFVCTSLFEATFIGSHLRRQSWDARFTIRDTRYNISSAHRKRPKKGNNGQDWIIKEDIALSGAPTYFHQDHCSNLDVNYSNYPSNGASAFTFLQESSLFVW